MEFKKVMITLSIICVLGIAGTLYAAILDRRFDWSPFVLALSSGYFLWYTNDTRKKVNERKRSHE
ncbi:hypothetical protein P9B03_16915 [Metasolibacillus meyeri]|uniref:Uncharacterized protein n=1 Tax=Metasolibacillus meyeri TaxID=1071052 RepID=A0AAW9NUN0_9BACL|nr:hypothetical protein [Metasolibacillus meyeri]MEC1180186.1 hypothetical protein [Metasolibacillus meyeri]